MLAERKFLLLSFANVGKGLLVLVLRNFSGILSRFSELRRSVSKEAFFQIRVFEREVVREVDGL